MSLYGEKRPANDEAPTIPVPIVPSHGGPPGPANPSGASPGQPSSSRPSVGGAFRPIGHPAPPTPWAGPPAAVPNQHGPGGGATTTIPIWGGQPAGDPATGNGPGGRPTGGNGLAGNPATGNGPGGDGPDGPGGGEPGAGGVEPAGPAPRRGKRRLLLAAGVVVAVLAAGLGTTGYANAGEIPRGTTVLGVELGGRSRAEAVDALRAGLNSRPELAGKPVTVQVGEKTAQLNPVDVGLAVDVEATVAAASETSPGVVSRLFGSHEVPPVVTVDAERLDTALREVVGEDGQKMTMPAITFTGTTPKPAYPKPGIGLDAERSAQALREGWLTGGPVTVPLVETHPATTREELDQLVEELAKPAVSAPVTVSTDRGSFTVSPAAIAKSLLLTADKTGKINPRVDEKKLRTALGSQLSKVEVKPTDASVSIAGGAPKVLASTGGKEVDTAALGKELLAVLPKADGRQVKGTLKEVKPKTSTEELAGLGIKERVSTFTTHFTGGLSSPRSQNIARAAQQVDGALVKPGEVFSLNKHTGDRNYAKGYKDAPTIQGGKLVPGVGGGVSQFTTTLFNATYYAGLEDVEHKPHSFYFSRYPAVIESTIFYPDLDFKFRNDSPHGVLIDTSYTSSTITVSIWSTKVFDKVSTQWGPRRNITSPKTVYLTPGPDCIEASGSQGFTQDAWRIFRKGGKEIKREKFSWTYDPEPKFICAKKP